MNLDSKQLAQGTHKELLANFVKQTAPVDQLHRPKHDSTQSQAKSTAWNVNRIFGQYFFECLPYQSMYRSASDAIRLFIECIIDFHFYNTAKAFINAFLEEI